MTWILIAIIIGIIAYFVFRGKPKSQAPLLPARNNSEISNELIDSYAKRNAKKPLHFTELLKEEFKNFSDDITFSKAAKFLETHINFRKERESFFIEGSEFYIEDGHFVSDEKRSTYKKEFAERTGAVISSDFKEMALSNPESYYLAVSMVDKAAELKLDLEFGDRKVIAQKALDEAYQAGLQQAKTR